MVKPTRPAANGFVAFARKIYNPIGFAKGYNFVLFFIFAGALMGFVLARFQYLNYYGVFCKNDTIGECFYMRNGSASEYGLIMHLACILPAGFLVVFQFVPAIRHRWLIIHRVSGYIILLLSLVSTVGAFMAARHSFGGGLDIQTGIGFIGIAFVVSMVLAYVNIKRLQIEQHRAWMLRGWFYATSIISLRLIMFIAASIISSSDGYYATRQCAQLDYMMGQNRTLARFPECSAFYSGEDPERYVLVLARLGGGSAATAAAALGVSFGPAMWLAFALHAIGIEIYLRLTPAEHERLRNVSYQRQLEAGMKNPGRAGLTADRLGDSEPWIPASQRESMVPGYKEIGQTVEE